MGREPGYPLPNRTGLLNRRIESDGGISRYPLTMMTLHNSADMSLLPDLSDQPKQLNYLQSISICLLTNPLSCSQQSQFWWTYNIIMNVVFNPQICHFQNVNIQEPIFLFDLEMWPFPPFGSPLYNPPFGSPTSGSSLFTFAESFFLMGVGWGFLVVFPDWGTLSEGCTAICVRGMVFSPLGMSSQHLQARTQTT